MTGRRAGSRHRQTRSFTSAGRATRARHRVSWALARRRRPLPGRSAGERAGSRAGNGRGTGYFTRVPAPVAGLGGRVTGLDPSAEMIDYARRRAPRNCCCIMGEGQALDLPDASQDVVV